PEVEAATTLTNMQYLFWKGEQTIYETGLLADEFLFDVFSYPAIAGDATAALKDRDAIILTASLAQKYFGHTSPINETIQISSDQIKTVKAVIEDIPDNQHFDFDFILSIENYGEYREDREHWRWASNNYNAYVVLAEGHDYHDLEKKLSIFDDKVAAAYTDVPFKAEYFLQPLKGIHLYSQINFESKVNGDIRYIYLAASIALIILLLALINYMNLTNASFSQRIKEVGVRKVLGAKRHQLVNQLMTESVLVTLIGFGMALVCAYLLLPGFNKLMDLSIEFELWKHKSLFLSLLTLLLALGILSGLYPALLSSSVVVVNAIKGSWHKGKRESFFFRSALLIGQFTAAIVLAISSIVVYQQLQYIQHKKLGYQREQVVYVPYRNQDIYDKASALLHELQNHNSIEKATIASSLPVNTYNQGIVDEWEGNNGSQEMYTYRLHTDQAYLDLFEIELLEGRNLSPKDTLGAYILNESAVKTMGWTTAVGKSFRDGKVIGVVKDFHFQPFDLA
ncbi:MAG: FtsX-like permease family protein, partial [Bacteroidota bacterium]